MNFVAVDFEVANMWNRASACAIGVVEVKNGDVAYEFYSLINPKDDFDQYCINIHGITPEMVEHEPTFDELWPQINKFFSGQKIVAHNASFDMSILRHCLQFSNISYPECDYLCTYLLSKRAWPGLPNYRLDSVSQYLSIDPFNHHNALEDAKTAAEILLNCLKHSESEQLDKVVERFHYQFGQLLPDNTYRPFSSILNRNSGSNLRAADIRSNLTNFDDEHPFYGKTVAFTGTLESMHRRDAMQKVVDVGGLCADTVNKKVNFLVVGMQDFARFKDGNKSNKLKKAAEYARKGQEIEIITEDDFLRML